MGKTYVSTLICLFTFFPFLGCQRVLNVGWKKNSKRLPLGERGWGGDWGGELFSKKNSHCKLESAKEKKRVVWGLEDLIS